MANYDNTIFKTENPEIFKAVIDRFEKMNNHWYYENHELLCLKAGG